MFSLKALTTSIIKEPILLSRHVASYVKYKRSPVPIEKIAAMQNRMSRIPLKGDIQIGVYSALPAYRDIEIPEDRQKLKFLEKVPQMPAGIRAARLPKNLNLIRGEEEIHTDYMHGQYGIVALRGGHLRSGHLEMIRMTISRKIDTRRMFAIWRIDAPWKPVTKKGIGKRMGGGKGNIHHYVTPVKAKRVIMELGGKCSFEEVFPMLRQIADLLPFPAMPKSQKAIDDEREEEIRQERENLNDFTFKYIIQNNMGGCDVWIKKYIDRQYFGKYV